MCMCIQMEMSTTARATMNITFHHCTTSTLVMADIYQRSILHASAKLTTAHMTLMYGKRKFHQNDEVIS